MDTQHHSTQTGDAPQIQTPAIPLWVVYDHPRDIPQYFVARMWLTDRATEVCLTADTLDELRAKLPPNLYPMPRHVNDDPAIVEIWL